MIIGDLDVISAGDEFPRAYHKWDYTSSYPSNYITLIRIYKCLLRFPYGDDFHLLMWNEFQTSAPDLILSQDQ